MPQNHVIDPTFFYDAIAEFAFDYDFYAQTGIGLDDYGRRVSTFTKTKINGSLQSNGTRLTQSTDRTHEQMTYDFYCKSLYRINIGDFIVYKDRYLHVDFVQDYDEWGVRKATLTMVNLNNHRDLLDYLKYLEGEKIV